MISVSVVFFFLFSFITFLTLRSLSIVSRVPSIFCSSPFFSHSPSSQFRSSSPRFLLHFLGICPVCCQFSIFYSFQMTDSFQPTYHQFCLNIFLLSNRHSQFLHSSLCTFLSSLRDMRLSPITLSTFLQAFASDVILIVTKTIYIIGDFALGNWHFLSWVY